MKMEQVLLSMLEHSQVGVFFCDASGTIRYINRQYAKYLGAVPEDVIGKSIKEVIPDTKAYEVMQSGIPIVGDICRIKYKGPSKTLVVNRTPVIEKGEIVGMLSEAIFGAPTELAEVSTKIQSLNKEVRKYKRQLESAFSAHFSIERIIGSSPSLVEAKEKLMRYAETDLSVLILGPTGVGKELFAQALHMESQRRNGPFICVNCAAIPLEIFESEMFGYAPGSFTGALKNGKVGQIELANNGTLFLDELGELSLPAQKKLLRVLEEKAIRRVGSDKVRPVDFRLVAATNQNLKGQMEKGLFREDLYYRISALSLEIPPLSERAEDIPYLVDNLGKGFGTDTVRISDEAIAALQRYEWPGNIRQLKNVVAQLLVTCRDSMIAVHDLPSEVLKAKQNDTVASANRLSREVAKNEISYIRNELVQNEWNMAKTAKSLGISRSGLYLKCKKLGIKREKE